MVFLLKRLSQTVTCHVTSNKLSETLHLMIVRRSTTLASMLEDFRHKMETVWLLMVSAKTVFPAAGADPEGVARRRMEAPGAEAPYARGSRSRRCRVRRGEGCPLLDYTLLDFLASSRLGGWKRSSPCGSAPAQLGLSEERMSSKYC